MKWYTPISADGHAFLVRKYYASWADGCHCVFHDGEAAFHSEAAWLSETIEPETVTSEIRASTG